MYIYNIKYNVECLRYIYSHRNTSSIRTNKQKPLAFHSQNTLGPRARHPDNRTSLGWELYLQIRYRAQFILDSVTYRKL